MALAFLAAGLIAAMLSVLRDAVPPAIRDDPELVSSVNAERDGLPTVVVRPFQVLGKTRTRPIWRGAWQRTSLLTSRDSTASPQSEQAR